MLSVLLDLTLVFFSFFLTQSGPELVPETRNADVPKQFFDFVSAKNYCFRAFFSARANLDSLCEA